MGVRLILSCGGALLAAALLQTATQPAHALTIRDLATTGDTQYIALEGKFDAGDDRKFVDKILGIERAVIVLESPGGMIDPALAIGRAIRLKGFDTVVRDGTSCASACGLVWLAGVSRYMGESARLGFHAVFVMEDGQAREKGAANAVVGAYLAMLGVPTRAIRYVTTAPPQNLSWLSFEDAKVLGIAVERAAAGFPPDAARTAKAEPPKDGTQSPPDTSTEPKLDSPKPGATPLREAVSAYQRGDYATAHQLFLPLAEAGDGHAETYIGLMHAKGEGMPQDYVGALRWFRRAALLGNAQAQHNLAYLYANGQGTPKDHREAVDWYRRAAEQGHANAQNNLGLMYQNGWGVGPDAAEAVDWYRKSATQGNASAQTNLGLMYTYGRGVTKDDREALTWYRKAADQGFAAAQDGIGLAYAKGRGVRQNHGEAVEWFRKAANQGYASAQSNLGYMYAMGQGVAKNLREAVQLYRKAADQGNAQAEHNLAFMYYRGDGVPKDIGEAVKWWRRAADQGHARAQNDFGWMYVVGHGVPKNYVQGYKWFTLAGSRAEAGEDDVRVRAGNNRRNVAAKMTDGQIAEAQRLAREWKPRPAYSLPAPAKIPNTSLRNTHSGRLDCKSIAAMLGLPADAPCEQTHETVGGENPVQSASRPQFVAPKNATRPSSVRNKTRSASVRSGGASKCSALQARCAIEAGGTCNPTTGHWRYMGYEHAHMRYNDCLSRGLASR